MPFMPPDHLREMIDDFELNEAPSLGLLPRPLGGKASTTTTPQTEEPPKPEFVDEDLEFFLS